MTLISPPFCLAFMIDFAKPEIEVHDSIDFSLTDDSLAFADANSPNTVNDIHAPIK